MAVSLADKDLVRIRNENTLRWELADGAQGRQTSAVSRAYGDLLIEATTKNIGEVLRWRISPGSRGRLSSLVDAPFRGDATRLVERLLVGEADRIGVTPKDFEQWAGYRR